MNEATLNTIIGHMHNNNVKKACVEMQSAFIAEELPIFKRMQLKISIRKCVKETASIVQSVQRAEKMQVEETNSALMGALKTYCTIADKSARRKLVEFC